MTRQIEVGIRARDVRQQLFPAVPLRDDDHHRPLMELVFAEPGVTPHPLDRLEQDRVLTHGGLAGQPVGSIPHLRVVALPLTCPAESRILGRVEAKEEAFRKGEVPGDGAGNRVGTGQEALTGVVVQAHHAGDRTGPTMVRVFGGRVDRKHEGTRQRDRVIAHPHLVVEVPLSFGFRDRYQLVRVDVQELLLFVFVQPRVDARVSVVERELKPARQHLPKLPCHRGQEVTLPARRGTEDRIEDRGNLIERTRDLQVTVRTRQPGRAVALAVDRVSLGRKPRRQKTPRVHVAQFRVADQIRVFGDPEGVFGGEALPAVRTGHLVQDRQAASRIGLGHFGEFDMAGRSWWGRIGVRLDVDWSVLRQVRAFVFGVSKAKSILNRDRRSAGRI